MANITNYDDTIDSLDVIARIDELESDLESAHDTVVEAHEEATEVYEAAPTGDRPSEPPSFEEWLDLDGTREAHGDTLRELNQLLGLAEECDWGDWKYGTTLVRETYFDDYARELAYELGSIRPDVGWPYTCIDWGQAAKELAQDYASVDFDGVEYLIRG